MPNTELAIDEVPAIQIEGVSLRPVTEPRQYGSGGKFRSITIGPDHDKPFAGMTVGEVYQDEDILSEDDMFALLWVKAASTDLFQAAILMLAAETFSEIQTAKSALSDAVRKAKP